MQSDAQTVDEYVAELPEGRRAMVQVIRETIARNLPEGYEEIMQYGMIGYAIPLSRYPDTYNKQPLAYVGIASQKNYVSVYLMGVYADSEAETWFRTAYEQTGMKLNMGKSCVRFKKLEDVPLDLLGEAVTRHTPDQFIQIYDLARKNAGQART